MEELRSSEHLYNEIQSDARKKADRVLKKADAEISTIDAALKDRIEKGINEQKKRFEAELERYKQNAEYSLPLERKRRELIFFDSALQQAVDNYFHNLQEEQKLHIIGSLLKEYVPVLEASTAHTAMTVFYTGYKKASVERLLTEVFSNTAHIKYVEISAEQAKKQGFSDGLYIEFENIVCKATVAQARSMLMNTLRNEMRIQLFGEAKHETL